MGKLKLEPVLVPADDCTVYIGRKWNPDWSIKEDGEPVRPHQGEWVKVIPVSSVSNFLSIGDMMREAGKTDMNNPQVITAITPAFQQLCDQLSKRIVEWNWTDWDGEPLEQPHRRPDVIAQLSEDEVLWLVTAVQGETPDQRKKDSEPSTPS